MNPKTPITPELDITTFSLPVNRKEIFGNDNQSALEIGFGEGEFIVETAENNPDWNYIGIEIKYFRYKKAVRLCIEHNLRNVKLLHFDADLVVEQVFTPNTFDRVFINFPDPWPKERHIKHRIINNTFLDNLYKLMNKDGILEFTSDHIDYVTHTIEHFEDHKKFSNIHGKRGYAEKIEDRPVTKFEKEFRDEGKPIYYLAFKK